MAITATVTGGAIQLTGNPVIINCTGGSVPSGASEYMILLKIISADGKLEGAPLIEGVIPDTQGNAEFDISGILDQPMEVSFQYPAVTKVIAHPTQAFNIQVQPGERYIDSQGLLVENFFSVSTVFQMVKGGLPQRQNAMMKALGETFYSKYIASRRFLTPRPWGDVVHPDQPIKLWLMVVQNYQALFKIRAQYTDGTEEFATTSIIMNPDSLYELNCNPALHGLALQPTYNKRIDHFDVSVDFLGSQTDTIRFHVDWNYCERPYFLMFANSLGGIDDVYLSGFGVDAFSVTGTQAYRPVRSTDTVYTPTIVSPNKAGQNKWKINSGWKSIATIQYFRDLMLSKQAWFLYPYIGNTIKIIVPIIIDDSNELTINRQDDHWEIEIEFTEAHSSRFSFDNRSI